MRSFNFNVIHRHVLFSAGDAVAASVSIASSHEQGQIMIIIMMMIIIIIIIAL